MTVLQGAIGLFAALAAVIYLAGGAVLGLRLAIAGVPALGVIGQLPREFLFSLGATQVVAPAMLLGVGVGVLEFGQFDDSAKYGHRPGATWSSPGFVDT